MADDEADAGPPLRAASLRIPPPDQRGQDEPPAQALVQPRQANSDAEDDVEDEELLVVDEDEEVCTGTVQGLLLYELLDLHSPMSDGLQDDQLDQQIVECQHAESHPTDEGARFVPRSGQESSTSCRETAGRCCEADRSRAKQQRFRLRESALDFDLHDYHH